MGIKDHLDFKEKKQFKAGQTGKYKEKWQQLTSDPSIIEMVTGTKIEFDQNIADGPPPSRKLNANMTVEETKAIDREIRDLLGQGVIEETPFEEGEIIYGIFTRKKKDNSLRLILNLKNLNSNRYIEYKKFKMETLNSALTLITQNCWMASVDLVSVYYSVPIAREHQKYLKFMWTNKRYAFTCYPNGLAQAPSNFTKITKPIYASLHSLGHVSTGYIDDSLLIGDCEEDCVNNATDTVEMLESLGFVIHKEKSVQRIKYLGIEIDSKRMTVSLTDDRKNKIKQLCEKYKHRASGSIRNIAKLIGVFVASFPGVQFGPLHYRNIDKEKQLALIQNKGNWDAHMELTELSMKLNGC